MPGKGLIRLLPRREPPRLSRRQFLARSALATAGAVAAPLVKPKPAQAQARQRRPNIIFVLTDDQARWGMGAYGNQFIYTPNMDRLANEGVRFSRGFVCTAVCSPSRTSFITGQYPHRHGIMNWLRPTEPGLKPEAMTLSRALLNAGYRTGYVGKWHLGVGEGCQPEDHGFEYFMGFLEGGTSPKGATLIENGEKRKYDDFLTDVLTQRAISYCEAHAQEPFFLFLSYRSPHSPYMPVGEQHLAHYSQDKTADWPEVEKKRLEHYASITEVDYDLGLLRQRLEELGLAKDTIIIFCGDNGYMIGQHDIWHTKGQGQGGNAYDEAYLVPYLVAWPGVIQPAVREEMVCNIDLLPSVLDLAGGPMPAGYRPDGLSFAPLLRGAEVVAWRDAVFGEMSADYRWERDDPKKNLPGTLTENPVRMIRTEQWKYVWRAKTGEQLFDLVKDPGETTNLVQAPEAQEMLGQLKARLRRWQEETGDPILTQGPPDQRRIEG